MKAVLQNVMTLRGLTTSQKEQIKQGLTFDNPRYLSALRYSRFGPPKNIPQHLRYYTDRGTSLVVPLHYPLPFPAKLIDKRVERSISWPTFKATLRPGQQQASSAYLANPENGQVIIDTGEGKTVLSYYIAAKIGQKALVLVDREAYMGVWFDDLKIAFGNNIKPDDIGIIKGNKCKIGKLVTVGFSQTLFNRLRDPKFAWLAKEFGIIIQDEADIAAAPSRFAVVQSFHAKYRLAVSGTTKRNDGMQFLNRYLFGDYAVNLQGQGTSVLKENQVQVRIIESKFAVDSIPLRPVLPKKKGDDVEWVIDYDKLWWLETKHEPSNRIKLHFVFGALQSGESCLVLTHRVQHAKALYLAIRLAGFKVRLLTGEKDADQKPVVLRQASDGEIQCVVSTFHYMKRGANVPRWSRAFAMTSTANETDLRQSIGRIRRLFVEHLVIRDRRTGKVRIQTNEKSLCIWYDFVANRVPPYRIQAERRRNLWEKMGFRIKDVPTPVLELDDEE